MKWKIIRVKSGNFGHQVSLDSDLVCFYFNYWSKNIIINKAHSENPDEAVSSGFPLCKWMSEFTWCSKLPDFTLLYAFGFRLNVYSTAGWISWKLALSCLQVWAVYSKDWGGWNQSKRPYLKPSFEHPKQMLKQVDKKTFQILQPHNVCVITVTIFIWFVTGSWCITFYPVRYMTMKLTHAYWVKLKSAMIPERLIRVFLLSEETMAPYLLIAHIAYSTYPNHGWASAELPQNRVNVNLFLRHIRDLSR